MILEEFEKSDSVFLDLVLDLIEQLVELALSLESHSMGLVRSLQRLINGHSLVWVRVIEEVLVLDIILLISVGFNKGLKFIIAHSEAKV